MAEKRLSLWGYVRLGRLVQLLRYPKITTAQVVFDTIQDFVKQLELCDLPRSRVAAGSLARITSIPQYVDFTVTEESRIHIEAVVESVVETLRSETGEKELAEINKGAIIQELRDLPKTITTLNPAQLHLLNETYLCIEIGAYRAGAVMAWNLAFDFVRQWAYDNHLATFNAQLATKVDQHGNPMFDPIVNYEDFFAGKPGERTVIETCFGAGLFGGRIRDELFQYLRRRNDYAHRSFTSPSVDQTNAYVKDLIDVITKQPFT